MRRSLIASLPLAALVVADCSCAEAEHSGDHGSGGAASGSSQSVNGGFSSGIPTTCAIGAPCATVDVPAGVCTDNEACCPTASACGPTCCDATQVCAFAHCVAPGSQCHEDADCGDGEYCDFSQWANLSDGSGNRGDCLGGVPQPDGRCMPKPPICPEGTEPGDPATCVTSCQYVPPANVFTPALKHSWGVPSSTMSHVMMTPVVVQLDDDNCDGIVDDKDIPEIVFLSFKGTDYDNASGTSATLRAIGIVAGEVVEKFAVSIPGASADVPTRSIAAGDVDGDGSNDIITCTKDGRLRAYDATGAVKWLSQPRACFMPSIADLDQDGSPEVIDSGHVVNGKDGSTKATFSTDKYVVVYDVDGDGRLDIVAPNRVYGADGSLKIDTGLPGTHVAVGDLDLDGVPEVVAVDFPTHIVQVWRVDESAPAGFEVIRSGMDLNEGIAGNACCASNPTSLGCLNGGGPPTIAHFNGDDHPDVGIAGGIGYVVFDGKKLMDGTSPAPATRLWLTPTQDCTSAQTGSSVFDFDGNGVAEVVYADETKLHVYDGPTGAPLFETCNTSGTRWEYPVVADVDNDGHADIVVASNSHLSITCDGKKTAGIRVFGDLEGKWVRTRRVWNQHAYMVTNVEESGAIPAAQKSNHLQPGLNSFRQNVQPSGQFSAPDLVVSLAPACDDVFGVRARVLNIGETATPPGVIVGFYAGLPGSGSLLGQAHTKLALYPLMHEDVVLPLTAVPSDEVYAVVDDGSPAHAWHECRTDNNLSAPAAIFCDVPE